MEEEKRTPENPHTPEPVSYDTVTSGTRSPAPLTGDRPLYGSVGHGIDETEFSKDPLTNADEVNKNDPLKGAEPFPGQFEKDGTGPSNAPDSKPLGSEDPVKMEPGEKGKAEVGDGNETTTPELGEQPASGMPAEASDLGRIGISSGDFGYNIGKGDDPGKEAGENPEAARRRQSLGQKEPQHGVKKSVQTLAPKEGQSPGTSAEANDLNNMSIASDDFGYNVGKGNDPGEEAGENPEAAKTRQSFGQKEPQHRANSTQIQGSEVPIEANDLSNIALESGDFGYNVGKGIEPGEEAGENPEAARRRQSFGLKEPDHSAKSTWTPETRELQSIHLDKRDIGPQNTQASPETRELRHIELKRGEFGYNPGKSSELGEEAGENPGAARRRQSFGQEEPQHGAKNTQTPETRELQSIHLSKRDIGPQNTQASPETRELRHIKLRKGDFGYNPGDGDEPGEKAGENPGAARRRQSFGQKEPDHSAKSTQSPETRELQSIHLGKRDIGPQNTQASPETRELRHIQLRKGEFGYNVGRGEESGHIRPDEDSTENPGASRARRRASIRSGSDYGERSNLGHGSPGKRRCSASDLGIDPPTSELRRESHCAHIPSFGDSLPRDTNTSDTLQSYLQTFLSERGSDPTGTASECPRIHSSQAMEGATHQKISSRDQQILECELNHHLKGGKQHKPSSLISCASDAAVTLGQLQQVLDEFKREILGSIDSRPTSSGSEMQFGGNISQLGTRLSKIESDISFIRKQISNNNTTTNGTTHPQEFTDGSANGGITTRLTNTSLYRRSREVRKMSWSTIALSVLTASSLMALGNLLGTAMRHEKGLGDMIAEWLFKEGRGKTPRVG